MYFKYFPKTPYDINRDGNIQNVVNITNFTNIQYKLLDNIAFYSHYDIQDGDRPDNVSYKLYRTSDYGWTFFLINPELENSFDHWPKGNQFFNTWVFEKYSNLAGITAATTTAEDNIFGKFEIGETVRGLLSDATGKVVKKFPTLGFIEIEPETGTFRESGETVLGITSQDSLTCQSIVKKALAPHHHIDISTKKEVRRRTAGTSPVTFYEYERDLENKRSRIRVIKPELIAKVINDFQKEFK